jgi:hypothetical protein
VNQIEAHPYLLQPQLFDFLKENVRLSRLNGVQRSGTNSFSVYRIFCLWLTALLETTSTTCHGMKGKLTSKSYFRLLIPLISQCCR